MMTVRGRLPPPGCSPPPAAAVPRPPLTRRVRAPAAPDHGNESGGTWACDFNPFPVRHRLLARPDLRAADVRQPAADAARSPPGWPPATPGATATRRSPSPSARASSGATATPMTAADVAFTFNLLKANHALDLELGVERVLVTASPPAGRPGGDDAQDAPRCPTSTTSPTRSRSCPQHVWSTIPNPVTYPDKNPVGTGAYTMTQCTPQNITYTANPHYWQPGLPKVKTVNYPAFLTNTTANAVLANGQAQWGGQFIPNIKAVLPVEEPGLPLLVPAGRQRDAVINLNLTNPPLNNLAVRQAMAYAINRPKASTIGEYGDEPGVQPGRTSSRPTFYLLAGHARRRRRTATTTPTTRPRRSRCWSRPVTPRWSDGVFAEQRGPDAVVHADQQRRRTPTGWPPSRSSWPSSWPRWASRSRSTTCRNRPTSDLYTGKYQLGYYAADRRPRRRTTSCASGCTRGNTAPIGKPPTTNYERYSNPATDALFNEYSGDDHPRPRSTRSSTSCRRSC